MNSRFGIQPTITKEIPNHINFSNIFKEVDGKEIDFGKIKFANHRTFWIVTIESYIGFQYAFIILYFRDDIFDINYTNMNVVYHGYNKDSLELNNFIKETIKENK